MEKHILSHKFLPETASVHIAPGGSVIYRLTAPAAELARMLRGLMSEIAYGMIDIETLDEKEKQVRAVIYFGAADIDDFKHVLSAHADQVSASECEMLPENTNKMGFSMATRNEVIRLLEM